MIDLHQLADMCERAEGPDRALDYRIFCACVPIGERAYWEPDNRENHFTASIDAAISLLDGNLLIAMSDILADGLPGAKVCSDTSTSPPTEHFGFCGDGRKSDATGKLALALAAACLRARAV